MTERTHIPDLDRIERWTQEASPVRLRSATDGRELMVIARKTVRDLCATVRHLVAKLTPEVVEGAYVVCPKCSSPKGRHISTWLTADDKPVSAFTCENCGRDFLLRPQSVPSASEDICTCLCHTPPDRGHKGPWKCCENAVMADDDAGTAMQSEWCGKCGAQFIGKPRACAVHGRSFAQDHPNPGALPIPASDDVGEVTERAHIPCVCGHAQESHHDQDCLGWNHDIDQRCRCHGFRDASDSAPDDEAREHIKNLLRCLDSDCHQQCPNRQGARLFLRAATSQTEVTPRAQWGGYVFQPCNNPAPHPDHEWTASDGATVICTEDPQAWGLSPDKASSEHGGSS